MFTKLEADITFSDIEEFCREFGEGVRVEYKREIQHIPKIVSSFANTWGGIFIIGVETIKWTPCRGQNVVKISKIFEINSHSFS